MYVIMDMGTTNTRLYLCMGDEVVGHVAGGFGASLGKKSGRGELCLRTRRLLDELFAQHAVGEDDIESIVTLGMAGSELGLLEVPHIPLPADAGTLAENIQKKKLDGFRSSFLFIPGVKKVAGNALLDMMRGEETEAIGLLSMLTPEKDLLLLLPGTHNKIVSLDKSGSILDAYTTLSGELLDTIISNTILVGQVTHEFQIIASAVHEGMQYAKENGLNAALFHIRVMQKNGVHIHALSSFLYGCVLGEDVSLIRRIANGRKVYVSGRKALREVYSLLLGKETAVMLDEHTCSQMMVRGAMRIKELYDARSNDH